jgi:hypothetical protein
MTSTRSSVNVRFETFVIASVVVRLPLSVVLPSWLVSDR